MAWEVCFHSWARVSIRCWAAVSGLALALSVPVRGNDVAEYPTRPVSNEPYRSTSSEGQRATRASEKRLLREGDKINGQAGEFRISGDSLTFYPEGGDPIRILENLARERIAKVLTESRSRREWSVSGIVTEYRGTNYLLINRAILKSRIQKETSG